MSTRGFEDVPPVFEGDPSSPAPAAGSASSKPTVQSLGNGYSLIVWNEPNPNYNPSGQYNDLPGAEKPFVQKSQLVQDKDAASVAAVEAARVAAGAAGTSARITTEGANQRAAVQAEIDRARNAADAAHQQALDALAQGNAAEARRQFAVTSQETQRAHDLDASIRQQEADLAKNKFGFDVYNKLSDLASNPRNYMEQFFRLRGSPPPANAAQYGNGGQQGIVPFEQFLPSFLRSTFGAASSSGQTGAAGVSSAPAAPASPKTSSVGPQNYTSPGPTGGYGIAQGAPVQNVTQGTTTTPIALSDFAVKNNLDLSKQGPQFDPVKQFADGGTLRMTAPHAIVNLLTGHVAAIAGEQPGAGPQGFVPETAKFDGQAMIDEGYTDKTSTPNPGDPIPPEEPIPPVPYDATQLTAGDTSAPSGSFMVLPSGTGFTTDTKLPIPGVIPADTTTYSAPHQNEYVAPAAPQPFTPIEREPVAPYVPPTNTAPTGPTPVPTSGAPSPLDINSGTNLTLRGGTPTVNQTPLAPAVTPEPTPTPSPFAPPVPAPNPAPSFSANTPSLSFLDSLRSLSQTPSGLGKNPSFLPEDAAAQNPIVRSLMDNGAFAPFLQRLYAQDKGLAGLGTNVPQQTNLPAGVPLASRLALSQMSPSELAAFQSFISANGLDWNDYLAMIDAASPQGGVSKLTTSLPKYLSQ